MVTSYLGNLNDIWEYDEQNNTWSWISGGSSVDQPGFYGVLNVATSQNVPGARFGQSAAVNHKRNTIWVFGGVLKGFGIFL